MGIARPASEAEARLTRTLAALLASEHRVLHIEGVEKQRVLEIAEGEGPIQDMPIRAFLRGGRLLLFTCP